MFNKGDDNMNSDELENIFSTVEFRKAVFDYLKENLQISIDINGVADHIIEVNLILEGETIDTDTIFVQRWMSGYGG